MRPVPEPLLSGDPFLAECAGGSRLFASLDEQTLRCRRGATGLWLGHWTTRWLALLLALLVAGGGQSIVPTSGLASALGQAPRLHDVALVRTTASLVLPPRRSTLRLTAPPAQPATPTGEAANPEEDFVYPVHYPPLSASALEARRQLFFSRNGPHWSSVRFDAFGLIAELATSDPALASPQGAEASVFTATEETQLQAFIARNADLFGVDDATALRPVNETVGDEERLRFEQQVNGWSVGTIRIFKSVQQQPADSVTINVHGHFWPDAALPAAPRVELATITSAVMATPYAFEQELPGYPCDPAAPGAPPCATPPAVVATTIRLNASELLLDVHPYLVRREVLGPLALRLVYEVDVHVESGGRTPLEPTAGWPKLFDAMTGEELTGAAWTCRPDAPATNCVVGVT